ncbi:Ger(x)C family spore germination protein [Metabacillus idriensis]|uniref:Ger(x)C family spore germination protein n=1 Tax=Metabacillus idriensis TaxID=324768 RepID=UPI003D283B16
MKKILLIFITLMLSGCWDSQNIEDLSLVVGTGVDKIDPVEGVQLVHQIIMPKGGSAGQGQGAGYKNITTGGGTVHEAIRNVSLETKPISSEHQRIFLINEEVIKETPLDTVINQFIRDDKTRRSLYIFLTEEPASELLSVKTDKEIPSNIIYELTENRKKTNKILPPLKLGEASARLQSEGSFAIQIAGLEKGNIKLKGAGVINNGKLVGENLTEEEVSALSWLNGSVEGGTVEAIHHDQPFGFEVIKLRSKKIKTKIKNGRLFIDIFMRVEGRLAEDWYGKENSFDKGYQKGIEEIVGKTIEKEVNDLIYKLQHDYKTGVAGLYQYVKNQHPAYWRKYGKQWDEKFSESEITYNVRIDKMDFGTKGSSQ